MATLLLVTDEAIIRKSIQLGLEQRGHHVLIAESVKEAMSQERDIDCVVCEHRLADGSGIDLISHFKPCTSNFTCWPSVPPSRNFGNAKRRFRLFHQAC